MLWASYLWYTCQGPASTYNGAPTKSSNSSSMHLYYIPRCLHAKVSFVLIFPFAEKFELGAWRSTPWLFRQ